MPTTEVMSIASVEGTEFSAHVARPDAGTGPVVVVLQEIFGVNVYIRDVCQRLAAQGYIALAPDLFWRIQPGIDLSKFDQGDLQSGMGFAGQFDAESGLADIAAVLDAARPMSSTGKVGVVGFCFGGTFAYLSAVHHHPDAVVSYYGSGVAAAVGLINQVECPLQFHFGGSDPYIPSSDVDVITAALAGHSNIELHVQTDGGHAFDNSFSEMFSHPGSATSAWELTTAFLAKNLPV